MNAHPQFAADTLRSASRAMSKLKAWRKAQLVEDVEAGGKRAMRLTDIPGLYGIPTSTWHQWEQMPGASDFRCPRGPNMARVCEITGLSPSDFYPAKAAPVGVDGLPTKDGG